MNFKRFTLLTLSATFLAGGVFLLSSPKESKYIPRNNAETANSADGYIEFIKSIKGNQITGEVSTEDVSKALAQANRLPKFKASLGVNWSFKGPDNIGGRTRAFIIDRNNSDHLFAGAVAGGLFESYDAGQTWNHYDTDFKVSNISTITQAADGSFYIGTGEQFAGGFSAKRSGFLGSGLYKVTGNGNYDLIVGPSSRLSQTTEWSTIAKVAAHPTDANILYAAMNNGFRKIDLSTSPATITNPITNITKSANDVEISSDGKIVLTFQGGEMHTSHNGVDFYKNTWSGVARGDVAISPSNSNIMYVVFSRRTSNSATNNCLAGVFRSKDGGIKWDRISPQGTTGFDMFGNPGQSCQGWWDMTIAVYPNDPGKIVVGGITTYRWEQSSVDPAKPNGSWNQIDVLVDQQANGSRVPNYVHADKHGIAFDPSDDNIYYIVNDGGIYKSTNFTTTFPTFQAYNFNYRATQYYDIGVNPNDLVMAGAQDNGTHVIGLKFNNNLGGIEVQGGDGFDAEMSTINPSIAIATSQNNVLRRIQGIGTSTGNSNFSSADITSNNTLMGGVCAPPNECSNVFYTSTKLWESFDHGISRDSVVLQITEKTLPPMKPGRVITYDSRNSNLSREIKFDYSVLAANTSSPASVLKQIDTKYTLVGNDYLILPTDTLIVGDVLNSDTEIDISPSNVGDSLKTVTVNFDTLNINTSSRVVTIKHPDGSVETKPYNVGQSVTYSNQYLDNLPEFNGPIYFKVDTSFTNNTHKEKITVIDIQIDFYYTFKLQDSATSIFASANWPGTGLRYSHRNVVITKDLMRNTPDIKWYNVAGEDSSPDKVQSDVLAMEFSNDGNMLFLGTNDGVLYRVKGISTLFTDTLQASEAGNWEDLQKGITGNSAFTYLKDSCEIVASFSNRSITGIAIDPNNSDNMVVTLGNYGNANFVYRTSNATTMPRNTTNSSFEIIQGVGSNKLPQAPVYSAVFDVMSPNKLLVGTEIGIFGTENVFDATTAYDTIVTPADTTIRTQDTVRNPGSLVVVNTLIKPADSLVTADTVIYFQADTQYVVRLNTPITTIRPKSTTIKNSKDVRWTDESAGMGRVPVFSLEQMQFGWEYASNSGKIYAGTHGRGVFETDKFVGISEASHNVYKDGFKSSLSFYPNPVRENAKIEFVLPEKGDVQVQIFDIRGKLVRNDRFAGLAAGSNQLNLSFDEFVNGTYIVRVLHNGQAATNKFVLYR